MERDGAISPLEVRWPLWPLVQTPSSTDYYNRTTDAAALASSESPLGSTMVATAPAAHWTERTILTILSNLVPASLVLIYLFWASAPVRSFILTKVPGISFLHHYLQPFISFEDIARSTDLEKRAKAIPVVDDAPQDDTIIASHIVSTPEGEVNEATPLLPDSRTKSVIETTHWPDPHVTIGLSVVSLLHIGVLVGHFCYVAAGHLWHAGDEPFGQVVTDLVLDAAGWVYVGLRTLFWPQPTPPFDTFVLLWVLLSSSTVRLHLVLVSWYDGSALYGAPGWYTAAALSSVLLCLYAITLVFNMPMQLLTPEVQAVLGYSSLDQAFQACPDPHADASQFTSPEDFCTLWQWCSFRWIDSLLAATAKGQIKESDVWRLGLELKARVLDRKWDELQGGSVVWRLWVMNSRDILVEFILTVATTVNAYAKPLILKRVLEGVESGHRNKDYSLSANEIVLAFVKGGEYTSRETAYAIAALGLILIVTGSQAEMIHLCAGRRACVRTRGELISAIFSKGLRCKDIAGAVSSANGEEEQAKPDAASDSSAATAQNGSNGSNPKKEEVKSDDIKAAKDVAEAKKAEDSQNGQGVGKAVSLMSVDANALGFYMSMLCNLYGAPLDLTICLVMLYTQLGWSAFLGFTVVPIVLPIQLIVMRVSFQVFKKVSNVRDKRMTALSELIGNLRLIKLINWEGKLSERVNKLRNQELGLMWIRAIFGWISSFLWSIAPSAISVIGLASYTLLYKHPLTVPVAFTAFNLYQQLVRPLAVLPMMINATIQMLVSAGRIERFLEYPEVPDSTSTLHQPQVKATLPLRNNIVASNATFRWHNTQSFDEPDKKAKQVEQSPGAFRRAVSKLAFWRKAAPAEEQADTTTSDAASISAASSSDPNAALFTLHDITLTVDEGLTLISGPTGSGKSSLLSALLGEMDVVSGKLLLDKQPGITDPQTGLHGGISFCAQSPWLQQKSVRDNILFGEPMDMERYLSVLEACALMPDVELFDDGDLQEIGEGGISLSGGQKARVALARAVYSRARTVLLDDVLSAVDSHTAQKLVTQCLTGPLMKNRCILLVTHHIELVLPYVQRVLTLEKGSITAVGTPDQLIASGLQQVQANSQDTSSESKGKAKSTGTEGNESNGSDKTVNGKDPANGTGKTSSKIGPLDGSKATHKIVEQERVGVGRVKTHVAMGFWMVGLVVLTLLLSTAFNNLGATFWLSYWASGGSRCAAPSAGFSTLSMAGKVYNSHWTPFMIKAVMNWHFNVHQLVLQTTQVHCWLPPAEESSLPYALIYGLIGITSSLLSTLTNVLLFTASLRASRTLFFRMLDSVNHSTARWLDKTPSGQILNRFGKDIESLDQGLLQSASMLLFQIVSVITTFVTLSVLVPSFIVPAVGVVWLYWHLSKVYILCSRDMRRLESVHRSPIFSGYSEALKGIATIRAFAAETRLLYEVYDRIDAFSAAHYFWWMSNRWLMLRVDCVGGLCVFCTQILALSGALSAGMAGIAITQAAYFTMSLYWLSRGVAMLEQELTSVERVVDYMPPKIPQEPPQYIEGREAPAGWPSQKASIKFDDVWLRYDKTFDPVLKGVSFEVRPGEKVGIVGRTGSGKSTCASSLLRFVDPEKGTISIEGIDIKTLGLHDLRSRISFIPQDPVLFQGTVRENLDPFDEHTDEECSLALAQVGLSHSPSASQAQSRQTSRPLSRQQSRPASLRGVQSTTYLQVPTDADLNASSTSESDSESNDLTLQSLVADSGGNLSQGQRQLLAMARALLSKNQIVIADEATASVDFAADRAIQKVIRDRFKSNIMLVIAHRLTTIAEFSRVLVLDAGKVVEFDTPAKLLAKQGGYFNRMAKNSGVYDVLVDMAKQSPKTDS